MTNQRQSGWEVSEMTRTAQAATRVIALTSLLLASGLAAAPLANATPATSASLAAHARPSTGHATTATRTPAVAPAPEDFASIYSGPNANLANSGWSTCAAPIEWTVDTRGLTDPQSAAQVSNLQWAFSMWSQASGLTFEYAGQLDVVYDDDHFIVLPADGTAVQDRHIYLDFVGPTESKRLGGTTVGLGSPSQVMMSTHEIVGGEAVFRTDHVLSASTIAVKSLYLHELGHVLGLAHAAVVSNIMYPVVATNLELGAGDVNGVRAFAKPCAD
jgi:hypothetical protein